MRPVTCCGQLAKDYRKMYFWPNKVPHSVEFGLCCKKCKRKRIPFGIFDRSEHMEQMEAVRLAGIAFDESLWQRGGM